jgi:hypothetical protein
MTKVTDANTNPGGETMQVDTSEFAALRAEVAKLTAAVRDLTVAAVATEMGRRLNEQPARATRTGRTRSAHLHPVKDDTA